VVEVHYTPTLRGWAVAHSRAPAGAGQRPHRSGAVGDERTAHCVAAIPSL